MSEQIRALRTRFDELAAKAPNEETKAIIEAIKIQTELLNLRLAPLENLLGAIATKKTN